MGKKIPFITFCLLFFCQVVFSQKKKLSINEIDTAFEIYRKYTSVIYDFNAPQPDRMYQHKLKSRKLVTKPWFGKRAMLTVKINPYLYDVFVSSRQVVDGGPEDTEAMRSLTTALDTLKGNRGIGEVEKSIDKSPVDRPSSDIADAMGNAEVAPAITKKVQEAAKRMNITSITEVNNRRLTPALEAFSEEIELANDCLEKFNEHGEEYKNKRADFHMRLDTFLKKAKHQQALLNDCDQIIATMLMDRVDDSAIVSKLNRYCTYMNLGELETLSSPLNSRMRLLQDEMSDAFDNLENVYLEMLDIERLLCSENRKYKRADSISFTKAKEVRVQLASSAPLDVTRGISMMINNLLGNNSFAHPYHSVLVEKDTLAYTIVTRPSSRFSTLINRYGIKLYNVDSFEHKIPTKGLFKLNFSVGMAFMYSSLRPTSYYMTPAIANVNNDSTEINIKEGKKTNRFRPAIAALAHAYWKLGGDITPALTIGISTNPTDFSDASYFLGLSAIMGHQNRFIFTVGVCGSRVEYLKSKYDLNKKYYKIDFVNMEDSNLSEKTFRAGIFFAVSYNISTNR